MKIIFSDEYKYIGFARGLYAFEDFHGDIILVKRAKYVDRTTNIVIMFLESQGDVEDIQYSFATRRKYGVKSLPSLEPLLNKVGLKVVKTQSH